MHDRFIQQIFRFVLFKNDLLIYLWRIREHNTEKKNY